MAARLPKHSRDPEALENRRLTDRSLEIVAAIARYRFIPTSHIVRLIEGNEDVTHRHLQLLFHKGLINRFAFPKTGGSNEFNYYLDNSRALDLLIENPLAAETQLDYEQVRNNKDKDYSAITAGDEDNDGRALFLRHELMISRFHFCLEMGCRRSNGATEVVAWKQGAALHSRIMDESGTVLPHRPDAFFTLSFPQQPEGANKSNFFYEADRKTMSANKMNEKFRAYLEFLRQRKYQEKYGIKRIRAILIETLDIKHAGELLRMAESICSHPLFWCTASEFLITEKANPEGKGMAPLFLSRPEIVLQEIWASTCSPTAISLAD